MLTLFRAGGALLFACSLARTAWVFTRVWPSLPAAQGRQLVIALATDAVLFGLFAMHHSLFARTRVRQWVRALMSTMGAAERSLFVWIASLLLLLTVTAWRPIGHTIYQAPGWLSPLMVALQLAGLVIVALAARVIDPLELAGLRSSRAGHLEARGPYHLVRHPIYLGTLLVAWATPTMTGDRLWLDLLMTLYLVIAIPMEERTMRHGLGAAGTDYDAYRTHVRWRVLPGLY